MASILTMPKSFDEITEPELLPTDWYTMRLMKDPETVPNAVLKTFMKELNTTDAEKALSEALKVNYQLDGRFPSLNWLLSLRVISDKMEINGRPFRKYLPLPNAGDKKRFTALGESMENWKMRGIGECYTAFTGLSAEGADISLEAGMMASFYVVQQENNRTNKLENSISMNHAPQSVS